MKTHPESVWIDHFGIDESRDEGSSITEVMSDESEACEGDIEFVSAAAYIELKSRVATALDTILRFGGIDGDHHKAWVIDQTVRALTGEGYDKWVDDYKGATDTDGEREYDWDEGIAP